MARKRRYHPDECKDGYLTSRDVDALIGHLRNRAKDRVDEDCLAFIAVHERIHRDVCLRTLSEAEAARKVDALANGFLQQHGDWVNNASSLYWSFYESVTEDMVCTG